MPTVTLIQDITKNYHKLTKAERKVADIVLAAPEKVLDATITDISELCGVGETSVFRFCRTMRLNGYQDFKLSLALSTGLSQSSASVSIPDGFISDNVTEALAYKVFKTSSKSLENTFHSLEFDKLDEATRYLLEAGRIYFFGVGGSNISALEAHNKFLKITYKTSYDSDTHIQLTTASLLKSDSVAVVFSNSGTTKIALSIAKLAKESSAKVIFITQFDNTPAQKYSDIILKCGARENPVEGGSISAKLSQLFIIDLLYSAYFSRSNESFKNKTITSAAIASEML